jgi:mitotic spindle assembly checkpoint protein MAD2B
MHTILYVRGVYPADLFVRRKKYDTPVWQSRHPDLNKYIVGAIRAVRGEMLTVRRFRV